MHLKNPTLDWRTFNIRSDKSTSVTALAAVVCESHYGEDLTLNDAQEQTARIVTPHVGMRFKLLFRDGGGSLIYTSEVYYKPVGLSLLEEASSVLSRQFPVDAWPSDACAGVLVAECGDE